MKKEEKLVTAVVMVLVITSVAVLVGCVEKKAPVSTPTPSPTEQANTVIIKNFAFNPSTLTIKVGTTITWINEDSVPHKIKSDTFSSNMLNKGDSFKFKFDNAGSYDYICEIHPSMNGKIIVAPKLEEFPAKFELREIASGLDSPVAIASAPNTPGLYVVEQKGVIKHIINGEVHVFLDIQDKIVTDFTETIFKPFDERGLLGLAFHPDFERNKKFYVYYSADESEEDKLLGYDHKNVVAEYVAVTAAQADKNSEKILLESRHPQFNHNSGQLAFGPDGYLYIGIGDGGGADDNFDLHTGGSGDWDNLPEQETGNLGNAQDLTKLNGKILRIDVDKKQGNKDKGQYSIPAGNPLINTDFREEIYFCGLRNPWRFSFDESGMYIADVGQNLYEELNLINYENGKPEPANLGWRVYEGLHYFDKTAHITETLPLIFPIAEYTHPGNNATVPTIGLSVTGGYVYRGTTNPSLVGKYIFADWSSDFVKGSGTILVITPPLKENKLRSASPAKIYALASVGKFITSFGEDNNQELYITATDTGTPASNNGYIYLIKEV